MWGKVGMGGFKALLSIMMLMNSVTARADDLTVSTEGVGGPGGYFSWVTHLSSPVNDQWSVWAGYVFLMEVSGAANTPSLMLGGRYKDSEREEAGGIAINFRRGPDDFSSTTLALDGGLPFHRLVPSVNLDTWVEFQLAFTSSQSITTSTTTITNTKGRFRRMGSSSDSSLFQTALGLDLKHPLTSSDTLHGIATVYLYNVSADRLAQLPAVTLPDSAVAVPSLPTFQYGVGTAHRLFESFEFSWDVTRTHDFFETDPIDALALRAGWDVTPEVTVRMSWTRVTTGAGSGNYVGLGASVLF